MRGNYKGRRGIAGWKILLALLLAGAVVFGVLEGLVLGGGRTEITGDPQVMVVLGCQVKPWGPSILLQDRLDTALAYLEDHPNLTVVVSGGQGRDEPSTEAQAMAQYLEEHGISKGKILQEDQSHNTHQNMTYTARRLEEEGVDVSGGVLVVSNGFHLARARMLAGRAGLPNVSTLAAPASHWPSRLHMYLWSRWLC